MHTPERRSLTILLGDDEFGAIVGGVIQRDLGDRFELRFLRFRSEVELRLLASTVHPDLIFLYISTIRWNPLPPVEPHGDAIRKGPFARWVDVLGELSRVHQVPVIATQGTDLRDAADRAGVIFLEAPFKAAQLMIAVRTALGASSMNDPPTA